MNTLTSTLTYTDIKNVFERFHADLLMLAYRTQAIETSLVNDCYQDLLLMAEYGCLDKIDIQLRDFRGNLVRAHQYTIQIGNNTDTFRPGGNNWPCLPNGSLLILIRNKNYQKYQSLNNSGKLKLDWVKSNYSTDYSGMRNDKSRMYASRSYGLQRNTFIN